LCNFWGVSDPLCLTSSSDLHFFNYSVRVHHPVNRDDWHLLAHAMAHYVTFGQHFIAKLWMYVM
jgi:hypothetical protein